MRKRAHGEVPSAIMLPSPDEAAVLGRAVVTDGRLKQLRKDLGITRRAMAELLHTNLMTYAIWERNPDTNLRRASAERVGRFYQTAHVELELLREAGIEGVVPLHVVATQLGVPQELLLQWYRGGRFEAVDAGILGLWVHKSDLPYIRAQR